MNLYFKPSDWLQTIQNDGSWYQQDIRSRTLVDQIVEYHLIPMNRVRKELGFPLKVNSGFRSVNYEKSRGRSGNSQHCFNSHGFGEKVGATDIDFWYNKDNDYNSLGKLLLETDYKRIAWYPHLTFFHCDYKSNSKQLFINKNGSWNHYSNSSRWLGQL